MVTQISAKLIQYTYSQSSPNSMNGYLLRRHDEFKKHNRLYQKLNSIASVPEWERDREGADAATVLVERENSCDYGTMIHIIMQCNVSTFEESYYFSIFSPFFSLPPLILSLLGYTWLLSIYGIIYTIVHALNAIAMFHLLASLAIAEFSFA